MPVELDLAVGSAFSVERAPKSIDRSSAIRNIKRLTKLPEPGRFSETPPFWFRLVVGSREEVFP